MRDKHIVPWQVRRMDLHPALSWLIDEAGSSAGAERFLAELGSRLLAAGIPVVGGTMSLDVTHPIIARRSWMWRADNGAVIEGLGFAASPSGHPGQEWLKRLSTTAELDIIRSDDTPALAWALMREPAPEDMELLRQVGRFAKTSIGALSARATLSSLLEAYLGRRSAGRVQAGAIGRKTGETIRAALLCADLRDFTAMSEITSPDVMIATLDAWFDRLAGAVHAFGGEVLKFIGDGALAIFPASDSPASACEAALRAANAVRAGIAHLNTARQAQELAPLQFGLALHYGEILWGNIGAADRLDFTAIGPAVNLVSRLEGLCRPLGRDVLVSGAVAAEIGTSLLPLGPHALRGIARPCDVFALAN